MPRPQRVNTDPTLGRNGPPGHGHQRRASAAEQSLQRSARRSSGHHSTDRSKMFADARSPLQRLELTLDSISKEDKRARVEAAERAAREKAAATAAAAAAAGNGTVQQGEKPVQPQQAQNRPRTRRPSMSAGDAPMRPMTPTRQARVSSGQNAPIVRNSPEDGRKYNTSDGPSPRAAAPESRIPVPSAQASGIPQRNLSFRERAARNDIKLPNGVDNVSPKDAVRVVSNKLKKPPPSDPWPNRISESDEIYNSGEVPGHTPRVVTGGPVMPITHQAATPSRQTQFEPAPQGHGTAVDDDDFGLSDEFLEYTHTAKPTRTASQRKADQILGRIPADTAPINGARHWTGKLKKPVPPAPATDPTAYAVSPPTHPADSHPGAHGFDGANSDTNDERRHMSHLLYHARDKLQPGQGIFKPTPYLDEWKKATVGTLSGALLDLDEAPAAAEKNTAWWEASQSRKRSNSMSSRPMKAEAYEGEYDEKNGTRTPNHQAAIYPSIWEVQSGDLHQLSPSDIDLGLPYQPQHLSPPSRRPKGRAKRWDGLRPLSPSPSAASDSQDSLGCFSLCSNDAAFSKQALSYSRTMNPFVSVS